MRWENLGESFWEPRRGPLVFYLFGLLSSVSANLWSNQVPEGSAMAWALQWGVPALVLAVILLGWASRLFPVYRQEPVPVSRGPAAPTKGLVVLASPGDGIETARHAVRYSTQPEPVLSWLWVLHSESSQDSAVSLKSDLLRTDTLPDDRIRLLKLSDQELKLPEVVHDLIESEVFQKLPDGLRPDDVTLDITGATKTATAGAFLAGLPPGRRMQIVPAVTSDERLRGVKPGDPIQIRIDYKLKRVAAR